MALNPYEFWRAQKSRVAICANPMPTCCPIFSLIEATFLLQDKLFLSQFYSQKATDYWHLKTKTSQFYANSIVKRLRIIDIWKPRQVNSMPIL